MSAAAPLLTVDLGNSRCKLRMWSPAGAMLRGETLAAERDQAAALAEHCAAWLADGPAPWAGALCAVGAPELEQALSARLGPLVAEGRLRVPESGLELDIDSVHTLGRDRLFAARGALAHGGASAVVVDAGTALTVDVLEVRGARALFRGGAISAGPQLVARALSDHAARLPRIDPRPGVRALGRDTRAALEAGASIGFRGAARELVECLVRECGLDAAPIYLTGGAMAFLLEPQPFVARRIEVVPDLVHLGLRAALLAALAGDGAASR